MGKAACVKSVAMFEEHGAFFFVAYDEEGGTVYESGIVATLKHCHKGARSFVRFCKRTGIYVGK